MSDKPLFQNADEHEALYAPHQLPSESDQKQASEIDDRDHDTADNAGGVVMVPAAGAGLLGQTGGGIASGTVGGAPSALGPAVTASAPEDETAGDRPV